MHRPSTKWIAAALLAGLLACTKKEAAMPGDDAASIPVSLFCAPLDTETGDTRTTHPASALTRVTNANYYLFLNGSLVGQDYFEDASQFAVTLPSSTEKYTLYLLANVGRVTVPSSTKMSDMGTAVHVDYGSRANYFSTIQSDGFPMAYTVGNFSA